MDKYINPFKVSGIEKKLHFEQLVPIIVKALKEISEWPWHKSVSSHGGGYNIWDAQNVSLATTFGDETDGTLFASSPLWLAQMVVGIIEERARTLKCIHLLETGETKTEHETLRFAAYDNHCGSLNKWWIPNKVLHEFGLTPKNYEWLRGKIDG